MPNYFFIPALIKIYSIFYVIQLMLMSGNCSIFPTKSPFNNSVFYPTQFAFYAKPNPSDETLNWEADKLEDSDENVSFYNRRQSAQTRRMLGQKRIQDNDPIEQAYTQIAQQKSIYAQKNSNLNMLNNEDIAEISNELDYESEDFNRDITKDTVKCFSCMSKFYEAVWPALSHVYKRPLNFTDKCNNDELDPRDVPVISCPTLCVGMWEEPTVAGHIRGCMDDLLHNGFNQTMVSMFRWMHRDTCRDYRKRDLFMLPASQSDDSKISVCTCYGDFCNAGSTSASTNSGAWTLIIILSLFLQIF